MRRQYPWWLGQVLVLLIAIWVIYQPSRKHLPHSDQLGFLIETAGHDDFLDLVSRTYSYNRTRVVSPGDTQLFRPLFFVWLSGLKAGFGNYFQYPQALGIALHALVSVLLLLLLREIFRSSEQSGDWRSPFTWMPFALTLFYALNYAIIEQVIWFNIQPYLIAVALIVASMLLLLQGLRQPAETRGRRVRLAAAWLLTLLSSFTYELGQFFAICAAMFLLVQAWPTRRARLTAFAAFVGIAVIYQSANQFDHWYHASPDDVAVGEIFTKSMSMATVEHSTRYVLYTIVQPFLPCDMLAHRAGKLFIGETIWFDLIVPTASPVVKVWPIGFRLMPWGEDDALRGTLIVAGLAVFLCWIWLVGVGLVRLWKERSWPLLALAAFFGAIVAIYAAVIILGRMNLRPHYMALGANSHYVYMALLWSLILSGVALAALRGCQTRLAHRLCVFLVTGLMALAAASACTVHQINVAMVRNFDLDRVWLKSLREFVEAHEKEPGFAFAVAADRRQPQCAGVPMPFLLYKQYAEREHAKYVLCYSGLHFEAKTMEVWQQEKGANFLLPDFVCPGTAFYVFEADGWFYAPSCRDMHGFMRTPEPWRNPIFHRDQSFIRLLEWVHVNTPPLRAAQQ